MTKNHEHEIAAGLRNGDREAWLRLYETYAERLWNHTSRLMGYDCPGLADVVQETFLAAAGSARTFDSSRGSLWNWLTGIARRQMALYYRKQDPRALLERVRQWWSSLESEKIEWINATKDTPPDITETRELTVLIRFALIKLPQEYQTLLLGKYVDGLSVEALAVDMDSSPAAVTSKLARARKAFRAVFGRLIQSAPDETEMSL